MAYREVFCRVSRSFSVSLFEGRTGSLSLIAISSSLPLLLSKVCVWQDFSIGRNWSWDNHMIINCKKITADTFSGTASGGVSLGSSNQFFEWIISSVEAACWLESLILASEKHLKMTCGGIALQDDAKVVMAWRIDILGSGWFLSNASIHILTTSRQYWALRLLITSLSVGWSTEYLFGGRNNSFRLVRFEISRWLGQLSSSSAIFLALSQNIRSSFRTHSSNSSLVIQLFLWFWYWQDNCLTYLKDRGVFWFPDDKHRKFFT